MPMRAFSATVPGVRRLGARRSIYLGCVWVCMCLSALWSWVCMRLCVTWVSRAMWAPFLTILGVKWAPFWSILWSTSGDLGVLGPPGGRLGAMLDPIAGQRGPSGQNWTKRLTLGTPFWGPFSALFRFFVFFWRPDFQSVFGRLFGSILECLGVICCYIFWICGVTLSMRSRK